MQIFPDDPMGFGIGIGEMAHGPVLGNLGGGRTVELRYVISGLYLHPGEIDAPAVDSGRCAGLKTPQRKAQRTKIVAEPHGGVHAVRA